MPMYRKRPVVIEAHQWDGTATGATSIIDWVLATSPGSVRYHDEDATLRIDTLEGVMSASAGDWIIRGVSLEHYPCKPDIFAKTYELVE
jgi:hypothetical protein